MGNKYTEEFKGEAPQVCARHGIRAASYCDTTVDEVPFGAGAAPYGVIYYVLVQCIKIVYNCIGEFDPPVSISTTEQEKSA